MYENNHWIIDSFFKDGIIQEEASTSLLEGIKEILDVGLVGVDPIDVEAVLKFGNAIVYSTQEIGIIRGLVVAQQAIAFLSQRKLLSKVQGLILSFAGDRSLRMREVHEALDFVNKNLPEDTYTLVGAVVREEMNETLRLTIIATGAKLTI